MPRCHTSYVTKYEPHQEEDCEEKFKKTCYIEYEQKAYTEKVQVGGWGGLTVPGVHHPLDQGLLRQGGGGQGALSDRLPVRVLHQADRARGPHP